MTFLKTDIEMAARAKEALDAYAGRDRSVALQVRARAREKKKRAEDIERIIEAKVAEALRRLQV